MDIFQAMIELEMAPIYFDFYISKAADQDIGFILRYDAALGKRSAVSDASFYVISVKPFVDIDGRRKMLYNPLRPL
jgi:hypothetical protein